MEKQVSIIGTGMDGQSTITTSALAIVNNADALIGAGRMTEPFCNTGKFIFVSYNYEEIAEFIHSSSYKKYAVLMSGDCGFYSGAEKLTSFIADCKTEIICGIPSPVYFSSKTGIPWYDWNFVSLHGVEANIVRNVCSHEKTFFILGGKITVAEICRRLCEYGLGDAEVYIGENLAYNSEKVRTDYVNKLCNIGTANLAVVLVINKKYEKLKRSGIPDSEFIRGKTPMTKSEIRSVCISELQIGNKNICWDIGCGSGSVSVEMAIQCTDGKVYAVDKSDEAVMLTVQNCHKFGCDNVIAVHDNAENAIRNFPAPDCVFVGGSGGHLDEIIRTAYIKNSCATIVVTAVSLETLNQALVIFENLRIPTQITQIAVTRTRKIGIHTMLTAENPIFIIKGGAK